MVCDSIEFHLKFENRHGQQAGSLLAGTLDEASPALLERCEDRVQSFF